MKTFVLFTEIPTGIRATVFKFETYAWGVVPVAVDIVEAGNKALAIGAFRRDSGNPIEVESVENAKALL